MNQMPSSPNLSLAPFELCVHSVLKHGTKVIGSIIITNINFCHMKKKLRYVKV